MSAVKIAQVKSTNGTDPKQKATLRALGLGRIGKSVEREVLFRGDSPAGDFAADHKLVLFAGEFWPTPLACVAIFLLVGTVELDQVFAGFR